MSEPLPRDETRGSLASEPYKPALTVWRGEREMKVRYARTVGSVNRKEPPVAGGTGTAQILPR